MESGEEEDHRRHGDEQQEAEAQERLVEGQNADAQPQGQGERDRGHRQIVKLGEAEGERKAGAQGHKGAPTIASASRGLNCARPRGN